MAPKSAVASTYPKKNGANPWSMAPRISVGSTYQKTRSLRLQPGSEIIPQEVYILSLGVQLHIAHWSQYIFEDLEPTCKPSSQTFYNLSPSKAQRQAMHRTHGIPVFWNRRPSHIYHTQPGIFCLSSLNQNLYAHVHCWIGAQNKTSSSVSNLYLSFRALQDQTPHVWKKISPRIAIWMGSLHVTNLCHFYPVLSL